MKRKKLIFFVATLALAVSACASDRFDSTLLKVVLRIETTPNISGDYEIGTGFLLGSKDDGSGRVFLVTNKHMIGDWNYASGDFHAYHPWLNVFFYRKGSSESYRATRVDLLKQSVLDSTRVHLHPSPRVDLVLIDVTDKLQAANEQIDSTSFGPSYLVPFAKVKDWQTDIGDAVIALGYPLGIRSLKNNYPIAKLGYLASSPGEEVSIPIKLFDRANVPTEITLDGKFLVVDGLITNGNSGGPVVLVGGLRTRRDPQTNQLQFLTSPIQNYVIGVVSMGLGGGLTAVVSSDYLLELLQSASEAHLTVQDSKQTLTSH